MDAFSIVFDQPQAVYYAGQIMSGNVCIRLTERTKMKGITLKLLGKCSVHWMVRVNRYVTYHYRADETYFDTLFALVQPESSEEVTYLAAGTYTYPFQVQLAATLPSPFKGQHGFVMYEAEARIIRPWNLDHIAKSSFTVLGLLNMNTIPPSLMMPETFQDSKVISCCCCMSGLVEAEMKTDRRCYVPGEAIHVSGKVINNSNATVKKVTANLVQYAIFYGFRNGIMYENITRKCQISNSRDGEIPAGQTASFDNLLLLIPSMPPSLNPGCRFIKITYKVEVVVDVLCNQLTLGTDLIICTEPLSLPPPSFPSLQAHQNSAFDMAPIHQRQE